MSEDIIERDEKTSTPPRFGDQVDVILPLSVSPAGGVRIGWVTGVIEPGIDGEYLGVASLSVMPLPGDLVSNKALFVYLPKAVESRGKIEFKPGTWKRRN